MKGAGNSLIPIFMSWVCNRLRESDLKSLDYTCDMTWEILELLFYFLKHKARLAKQKGKKKGGTRECISHLSLVTEIWGMIHILSSCWLKKERKRKKRVDLLLCSHLCCAYTIVAAILCVFLCVFCFLSSDRKIFVKSLHSLGAN